jgi:hypothetical protein
MMMLVMTSLVHQFIPPLSDVDVFPPQDATNVPANVEVMILRNPILPRIVFVDMETNTETVAFVSVGATNEPCRPQSIALARSPQPLRPNTAYAVYGSMDEGEERVEYTYFTTGNFLDERPPPAPTLAEPVLVSTAAVCTGVSMLQWPVTIAPNQYVAVYGTNPTTPDHVFARDVVLEGFGSVEVNLVAVDHAGNRSEPVVIAVNFDNYITDAPPVGPTCAGGLPLPLMFGALWSRRRKRHNTRHID